MITSVPQWINLIECFINQIDDWYIVVFFILLSYRLDNNKKATFQQEDTVRMYISTIKKYYNTNVRQDRTNTKTNNPLDECSITTLVLTMFYNKCDGECFVIVQRAHPVYLKWHLCNIHIKSFGGIIYLPRTYCIALSLCLNFLSLFFFILIGQIGDDSCFIWSFMYI